MNDRAQIEGYLESKVNPIFEEILTELIKSRPKNIFSFCRQWFDKKVQTIHLLPQCSDSEDSEEEILNDNQLQERRSKSKWYEPRKGICGEVYGSHRLWQQFELPVCGKKSTVNSRILFRLKSLFLFKDFDDNDIWKLINAMQQVSYSQGQYVVKQGESGHEIFIVDSGQLECLKGNGEQIYLKTIKEGEMFGQMSMLYNTPRSASIRVKTHSVLFKLDRRTYYCLINDKNIRKRKIFQSVINRIDILRELQAEERYKLQDLIKQIPVHLNQYIIREGKNNNKLYIIESGKFVSIKKQKNGHDRIVSNFKEGDYFGEFCLVSRRVAVESVLSLTNGKLYVLQKDAIQRVLGGINKIMKRSIEIYERYKNIDNI